MPSVNQRIIVLQEKVRNRELDEGYMYCESGDWLKEFINSVSQYMQKYDIGQHLSPAKWDNRARKNLRDIFRRSIKVENGEVDRKKNQLEIYDEIKREFEKNYTAGEMSVVARTETANIRAVMALERFKEAGFSSVRYKTRNDAKVSRICARLNNRTFKIDSLINKQMIGEERIPTHPNCRCRYEPVME